MPAVDRVSSTSRRRLGILRRPTSASPPGSGEPANGSKVGRRAFLGAVGLGVSSLFWGGKALDVVTGATTDILPESLRAAVPIGGRFRIYAVNPPYPRYDPATWRLSIGGLVERPQELGMRQLRALPVAEQTSDFHCVTGWSVLGVRWRGVRFDDLLREAGVLPEARALRFVSTEEPYDDVLTLDQLRVPDAMLAFDLDDKPLSRAQGAPARVVMPRMYGYKGVKWLRRIELVDAPADGYWEQRGYDRDAWLDGVDRS